MEAAIATLLATAAQQRDKPYAALGLRRQQQRAAWASKVLTAIMGICLVVRVEERTRRLQLLQPGQQEDAARNAIASYGTCNCPYGHCATFICSAHAGS